MYECSPDFFNNGENYGKENVKEKTAWMKINAFMTKCIIGIHVSVTSPKAQGIYYKVQNPGQP